MNRTGFTLIELLVVSIIILTVSGIVIASYNNTNDEQKVRQAAMTLKNDLRFVQARATNGEKPTTGCSELLGYRVTFLQNAYTTQAQCAEGPAGEEKNVTLTDGLSFASAPSSPMLFGVLARGVDIASDETIVITGRDKSYQIQVSSSGDISEVTKVQ